MTDAERHWQPTEGGPLIHRKIIEVMRAVGPVAKAGHYKEGNTEYNYRRADDVFDALHPAMADAGIYPKPIVREVRRTWGATRSGAPRMEITLLITYRFTAEDGSYEDVLLEVDNWNTSDKGIGAALTVALRMALLQLFVIPTGDPDPDSIREETGTAPALSPALVRYLATQVDTARLDRLEELYQLLEAHVAPDSPVPGDKDARVWWELWAARYLDEVKEAAHDAGPEGALRDLWKLLGPFGRAFGIGQGRDVNKAITEASMRWSERQKLTIDEAFQMIKGAETPEELDGVATLLKERLQAKAITISDSLGVLEVLEKKRGKLADPHEVHDQDGNGRDDD